MKQLRNKLQITGAAVLAAILLTPCTAGAAHDANYLAAMGGSIPAGGVYVPEQYNFYEGECVSFAAWRLNRAGVAFNNTWRSSEVAQCPNPGDANRIASAKWNAGRWSHAWQWYYKARHLGLTINTTPAPNAIYCSLSDSAWGHVGVVDSVNSDGSAVVSDYNWRGDHQYTTRSNVRVNGTSAFFIHFISRPDAPWGLTEYGITGSSATLDWATVNAADAYRVQISRSNSGWSQTTGWDPNDSRVPSSNLPVNAGIAGAANSSYTWQNGSAGSYGAPLAGQTYYWSVRVNVPGRGASVFTAPRAFTFQSVVVPVTPTDDHGNSTSAASWLSLNTSAAGSIETSGDVDFFRLSLNRAQTIVFTTTGSTDTMGDLYNPKNVSQKIAKTIQV